MKKLFIVIVAIAVCVWLASDMWARGGRGGGGGGGGDAGWRRGGGGGGARRRRCAAVVVRPVVAVRAEWWRIEEWRIAQCASRTPSMSRPSTSNVKRPSGAGQVANNRPSMGTLPTPGNAPRVGKSARRRQRCQPAERGYSAQRRQRCQSAERRVISPAPALVQALVRELSPDPTSSRRTTIDTRCAKLS